MTTEEALIEISQLQEQKHKNIGATAFELRQICGLPLRTVLADLAEMRESGIVKVITTPHTNSVMFAFTDPMYYNPAFAANRAENAEMPY